MILQRKSNSIKHSYNIYTAWLPRKNSLKECVGWMDLILIPDGVRWLTMTSNFLDSKITLGRKERSNHGIYSKPCTQLAWTRAGEAGDWDFLKLLSNSIEAYPIKKTNIFLVLPTCRNMLFSTVKWLTVLPLKVYTLRIEDHVHLFRSAGMISSWPVVYPPYPLSPGSMSVQGSRKAKCFSEPERYLCSMFHRIIG